MPEVVYVLRNGKWKAPGQPDYLPGQPPITPQPPLKLAVSKLSATTAAPVVAATFPGDPGNGKYYVSWAGPQTIATGNSWSNNKISVWHEYSSDTNRRVQASKLDTAINAGCIASQSFKLGFTGAGDEQASAQRIVAGTYDADIDASIATVKARAPHPIWLCYWHEPGGDFTTDAARADYRAAFRYIVGKFKAAGVTNVGWQAIQEAPYDFRPTSFSPGGGRGVDWRKYHPDWKGTTTNTAADWYTGANKVCDMIGLDIYCPLVGGTSFQDYDLIWKSVSDEWTAKAFPVSQYGGVCIMEMGWSDVITPNPDWLAYSQRVLVQQGLRNIKCFTWWNNNNATPRRYDFTAASDADGDKLAGWQNLCAGAAIYQGGA